MAPDKELKVKSPSSLAHVALRTGNYQKMVDFYMDFLGAEITFMNQKLAFLRYDEEHHRIAIIAVPGTGPKVPTSAGLEHIAFAFSSLSDLVLAYQQRKTKGMLPNWCVNHGPTMSIYYSDPDGNRLETQVDNFDTVEETSDFMKGECFAQNPIGTDFEPEDLMRRIESGESEESVKRRIEIGPRDLLEGF